MLENLIHSKQTPLSYVALEILIISYEFIHLKQTLDSIEVFVEFICLLVWFCLCYIDEIVIFHILSLFMLS